MRRKAAIGKALAVEHRAVCHHDELALARLHDVLNEIDGVRAGQRLAAGQEEAFGPESHAAALSALSAERLRVQISLDGASAEVNDPIRGDGTFLRIVNGIRAAVAAGLRTTITMVLLRHNLSDATGLVNLAADLGVSNVHLLWPHRRGRLLTGPFANLPDAREILDAVRAARLAARERGVTIDNIEELRLRFDGPHGVKNVLPRSPAAGARPIARHSRGARSGRRPARVLPRRSPLVW